MRAQRLPGRREQGRGVGETPFTGRPERLQHGPEGECLRVRAECTHDASKVARMQPLLGHTQAQARGAAGRCALEAGLYPGQKRWLGCQQAGAVQRSQQLPTQGEVDPLEQAGTKQLGQRGPHHPGSVQPAQREVRQPGVALYIDT